MLVYLAGDQSMGVGNLRDEVAAAYPVGSAHGKGEGILIIPRSAVVTRHIISALVKLFKHTNLFVFFF